MIIEDICKSFGLKELRNVQQLSGGLISQTYKVELERGVFVLQKLPKIFDHRTALNAANVTMFLRQNGFLMPRFLLTKDNKQYFFKDGYLYWAYSFIEGKCVKSVLSPLSLGGGYKTEIFIFLFIILISITAGTVGI